MPFQLDSGVPLSFRGPSLANPMELQHAAQQMQMQQESMGALADQRRMMAEQRRQQMAAAEQAAAESTALRGLFSGDTPPTNDQIFAIVGPDRGTKIVQGLQSLKTAEIKDYKELQGVLGTSLGALQALPEDMRPGAYTTMRNNFVQRGWLKPDDVPEQYSPEYVTQAQMALLSPKEQIEMNRPKTHEVGGNLVQVGPDGKATTVYEAPAKEAEAGTLTGYLDSYARANGLKTGKQLSPTQIRKAKAEFEAAGRAPSDTGRQWVLRDGQHVRVSESEIRPGDKPTSARDVGRQVTSGDAAKFAELDTALDDVTAVRSVLTAKGATGAGPAFDAAVPNWITSATGWGKDAKKTQAVIDRVKQAIGKAFEGGVLRKEDEAKYAKILPTISDAPEIVVSKLDGLEAAIKLRKQREVDAREDAGYDVSRFRSRGEAPPDAGGGLVQMRTPDGRVLPIPADKVEEAMQRGATRVGG